MGLAQSVENVEMISFLKSLINCLRNTLRIYRIDYCKPKCPTPPWNELLHSHTVLSSSSKIWIIMWSNKMYCKPTSCLTVRCPDFVLSINICFIYCTKAAVLKKEKDQQRKVLKKERKMLRTVTKVSNYVLVYVDYRSGNWRWKYTSKSNGQQFHQYQQNKQLHVPLTSNHWT